jgi:hypothetical protein
MPRSDEGETDIPSSRNIDHPRLFLIAAAKSSKARNKAFGIRLPLLGYPAISLALIAALTPERFQVRLIDEAHEPVA